MMLVQNPLQPRSVSIRLSLRAVMGTPTRGTSMHLFLPLPSPKAPPGYPDLYGKRREMAKIQMLEREISFLEEELKSSEGLQPASRCCKEIADFVMANSDPLLPMCKKNRRSLRSPALSCLGSGVGAVMVAVSTANHAIAAVAVVFHLSIALAALVEYHIAAKIAVVAKIVAFSQVAIFGGLFPLAAFANALALALAQPVLRFAHVAVVQIPVGTLAPHVASIVV
ncbi:Guanine nucleotide-binding protein subunit gamma 3, partial [Mucuna pruriens]